MGLFASGSAGQGVSTLKYVDIKTIKDGVVVLNNGAMRAVLLVSSVNFDLKSSDEQTAIIGAYQNFLNSLDFPVQIVVSSRKLNITPYAEMLKEKVQEQHNELLKIQIVEYREFIKNLTEVTNIMSKSFYLVVPFAPVEDESEGMLGRISKAVHPSQDIAEREELFETYKNQLWQRVDHVAAALGGTGLHFTTLTTDELIELYYGMYNPSEYSQATIKDITKSEIQQM
ncbi:MAG: hypothetical protein CR972_05115 [Candidatus Moraniibacteriota bacterium]|nr:MAG: hypothetical protein CR972_05115 [Candidatus Moranbacteria bacterium]